VNRRIHADTGKRVRIFGFVEAQSGTDIGNLSRGSARYTNTLNNLQTLLAWATANNVRVTVWGVKWQHGNADYFDVSGWHYKAAMRTLAADLTADIKLMNPTQRHEPIWFIRQCDVACRYGGEELMVLLPDCTLADATAKAEILRGRIEGVSDLQGVRVTASFGVASIPETAGDSADMLSRADSALYAAKREGRNRAKGIIAPAKP